jgi:Ca-activated chloride channel family protein
MQEGVRQVRANFSPARLNRVVVLTDGQTSGEDVCHQIVRSETSAGISFSTMGVGTAWNENLLKTLATDGKGNWHYIDSAAKAQQVFGDEFQQLASTAFSNVRLSFRATKDVTVRKSRQVIPECSDLPLQPGADREWVVDLQTMQNNAPRAFILDLALPRRAEGQYAIGNVECKYDVPAERIVGESTGVFDVRVTYTSDPSQCYMNAQVAKFIDELQTYEVAGKIQTALAQGDKRKATMLAQNLQKTATRLGSAGAKKTQLANQVLAELEQGGALSRKTQLALHDGARKTQLAE